MATKNNFICSNCSRICAFEVVVENTLIGTSEYKICKSCGRKIFNREETTDMAKKGGKGSKGGKGGKGGGKGC